MPKSACFDVLGTCFSFEAAIKAIDTRLGSRLKEINVDPKTLFFSWFYAAQRDFTYTTVVGQYIPIAQVLKHTYVSNFSSLRLSLTFSSSLFRLRRACLIVDLPQNRVPTDDDVEAIMHAVTSLEPRPGLKTCFDGLRESGWDVYGVTNGGKQTSLNYYRLANIELDEEHLLSCDDVRAAKPDVRVYENAQRHLNAKGLTAEDGDRWFVAAHAWDLIAAREANFKTAYLDFEEHDPVTEVFGEFDLYATSMEELLEKMKRL